MSEENVEIVREVYEAVARGDTAAVLAAYDPEVEWEFSASPIRNMLKQVVYRGHDGHPKLHPRAIRGGLGDL